MFSLPRPRPVPGQPADLQELEQAPYLPLLGPPPLRFQEELPPPDLVTRPAAGAPPVPALTPTESSVALANAAAAQSAATNSRPPVAVPPSLPNPVAPLTPPVTPPSAAAPAPETPPAILPDDARPAVRPEDFLPYFQVPGSAMQPGDMNMPAPRGAPAPAPLPPSSATYIQSK